MSEIKGIFIKDNGSCSPVEFDPDDHLAIRAILDLGDSDGLEVVRTQFMNIVFCESVCFMCDDSFLFKDDLNLNKFATYLYQGAEILGNVLLCGIDPNLGQLKDFDDYSYIVEICCRYMRSFFHDGGC